MGRCHYLSFSSKLIVSETYERNQLVELNYPETKPKKKEKEMKKLSTIWFLSLDDMKGEDGG